MNWKKLKDYCCPKDGEPLKDIGRYHACTKCVFSINKEKFDEIIAKQYNQKRRCKIELVSENEQALSEC
jgi:hypothetical protein